jgi:hypothetical protein
VLPGGGIVSDVDERWKPIGQAVLNELSCGRLNATGREFVKGKRLNRAPISADFWRDAKFTYWFLDPEPSTVQDATNGRSFAEVEVKSTEAIEIWPEYVTLFEAATRTHERLDDSPISILASGFTRSPDDILIFYCDRLTRYQDGKEPLIKLYGVHLPGRESKEIYMAPLTKYVFVVENGAISLQYPDGSERYVSLTVNARELAFAIERLASIEV